MLIAYLSLISGLLISAVAIYYSVEGLVAIYPAMVIPIIIMGVAIELGKLSLTVWLKQFWDRAPIFIKAYMLPAVAVLMLITSIGVFGFLSKAHSDQILVSGDVQSKLAIYDEKIKTAKDNIEANRKQLKQMDEAVDQIMGRSSDEKGADKANAVRKSQLRDRVALAKDIEANQKIVAQLNDEAAPIRAENRKVEADVGPIKYIAAFIYGSNPDANVLEKAVTWITVLIVIVLDPLAVVLLLASQYSFAWAKEEKERPTIAELDSEIEENTTANEILQAGVANTNPADNMPIVEEGFEGVKDPKTGEWIQTGPSFQYEVHPDEGSLIKYSSEATREEDEAFAELAKRQEFKPATVEYQILEDVQDEESDVTPYIKPPVVATATTFVPPASGYYEVTHTDNGVILKDRDGAETHVALDMTEPTPTYVQNEEQQEGGLWQTIVHPITSEEYQQKAKKNDNG
jgi:hypothetical protein